ncbi:MAG: hypothetical protein LAT68_06760 [Cyclobacteriaceae bacterium]|nr:hypothetical protein [Cyclobacteriaceae bacterium]MCH8516013.1 hypothetical protein [Cyclobacteriaceae bacterium]
MIKRNLLLAFLGLFLFAGTNALQAQDPNQVNISPQGEQSNKFYFSLSSGYAFGITGGDMGGNFVGSQDPNALRSYNRGTLGEGVPINLRFGYQFNPMISFDLGVQYFAGTPQQVQTVEIPSFTDVTAKAYSNQMRINPTLTFTAPLDEKWNMYSRVGAIMPVGGAAFIDVEGSALAIAQTAGNLARNFERTEQISGNFSVGFTGALGIERKLSTQPNNHWSIFFEAEAMHLNLTRNTGEITTFNLINNNTGAVTDLLEGAPRSATHINYVNELNAQSNSQITNAGGFDPNQPMDMISTSSFYHHLSLQLGIKYKF